MDMILKLALLDQIYSLFDDFARLENVACKRQCATCCTCNMTLTTLEGYKIISLLDARVKSTLVQHVLNATQQRHFKPQITTNQIARYCMTGHDIPQETLDPAWGSCPLLSKKECSIYQLRPFGCRCMVSRTNCADSGYADIDEFTLTVANLFNQVIEHIDQVGMTGNVIDMLVFLNNDINLQAYQSDTRDIKAESLIPNCPIPVLMIAPEHRKRIEPLLESLKKVLQDYENLCSTQKDGG